MGDAGPFERDVVEVETERLCPSDPLPRLGSLQHERAALWLIVRYVPVLVGVVLLTTFGSSVLYDNEDLAHCSWSTGGELLGAFADFARLFIVPLFLLSALLKRGPRCLVRLLDVTPEEILLEDEAGKLRKIPHDAVKSVFAYPDGAGSQNLVFELSRGLFAFGMQGDKITLGFENAEAKRILAVFKTPEVEVRLGTKSPRFGGFLIALSLALGTLLGVVMFRSLFAFVQHLPRASHYLPVIPDADRGWLAGLAITCMGVVHAGLAWFGAPAEIKVGENSLTLKSLLGSRTIAYADIESISTSWRGFVIELTSDERVERTALGMDSEKRAGFIDLVRSHVARIRDEVPVPSGLERGTIPVDQWRRSLARRAQTHAYRVAAFDPDMLLACVTAAAVPRDIRIGAAIALSSRGDREDKKRLLEVANDVSPPRLRALYEQLAEGQADDEDIEALLRDRRKISASRDR